VKARIRFVSCSSRTWRILYSQCTLRRPLLRHSLLLSNGRGFASCTPFNGRGRDGHWGRFITRLELRDTCKSLVIRHEGWSNPKKVVALKAPHRPHPQSCHIRIIVRKGGNTSSSPWMARSPSLNSTERSSTHDTVTAANCRLQA
jgi:hypothetical protein